MESKTCIFFLEEVVPVLVYVFRVEEKVDSFVVEVSGDEFSLWTLRPRNGGVDCIMTVQDN